MITKSLGILKGGERYGPIDLPPVPLSRQHVCARAVLDGSLINSTEHNGDATMNNSGTRSYDAITGYHTASMLVVPMEDDKGHVIGVLQLLNALDDHGTAVVFPQECEQVIRALASQAAISLTNMNYAAEVQELLDSFVRVISTAIDARTPYNANHTRGMVRVGSQFIEWLNSSNGDWQFTPEKKRLFLMSVWFHDIGKLTVPLEIMDKASRLGQQVPAVGYRFQVISLLNKVALMEGRMTKEQYQQCSRDLADADSLIREANQVYLQSADQAKRIAQLGKRTYLDEQGNEQPWLTAAELASLSIPRGTLSPEERAAMQNHVVMTSRMLQEMKFPPEYDCVPEWAGMHHEFLNGKGYPKGLSGQELPKEARLLTVLDIFDALTQERPYSPAQPVEQALAVLDEMAASGQLDTAIVAMFKDSHAWEEDTTGGGAV